MKEISRGPYYEKLENDFSAEKKVSRGTANRLSHIHEQYELLLCLSDNMFCNIDKRRYRIDRNTLLLFNNMDLHHFGACDPEAENNRYVVYFKPAYIDSLSTRSISLLDCFLFRPFPHANLLPLTQEQSENMQRLLDRILLLQGKSEEECYGKELYLHLLLAELMLDVNTIYRACHQISAGVSSESHHSAYQVINYIHEHYNDELSLDLLSHKFYVNKYYLCEIFREVTGVSPNQYIINCRIMKAKELLMNGCTVENTCAETGFNNMSHFSRTFKNKVGQSPKQFQKSMREQNRQKEKNPCAS